jgi:hypothetical protein
VEAFEREAATLVRAYLASHQAELRDVDLDLATFVCVSSVEALAHGAVLRYPKLLARDRLDSFIDETSRLVMGYLT